MIIFEWLFQEIKVKKPRKIHNPKTIGRNTKRKI